MKTACTSMPIGRHKAPASCFAQGTAPWVAKDRALSGRRKE